MDKIYHLKEIKVSTGAAGSSTNLGDLCKLLLQFYRSNSNFINTVPVDITFTSMEYSEFKTD